MNKSAVILIALIYVAAIAVVSFFGLDFKVFDEVIPVSNIEIVNNGLKYNGDTPYAVIQLDKNGHGQFLIEYKVTPENATNTGVSFAYDTQSTIASVDERGLVTFTGSGYIVVTLIPSDGSDTSAKIQIIAKK
jgi:hypothetical protein